MKKMKNPVVLDAKNAFPKSCLRVAKAGDAGVGVTSPLCGKGLFRWVGKGVGRSRETPLPFPPHLQQRVPPIARGGVPSLKNGMARAL